MDDLDLVGAVCARICHDLVSPVGAVVNGADLIRELQGTTASDEFALIDQSAQRAAALLKFLRLAFGRIGDPTAMLSRSELRARADAVLVSHRVSLAWDTPEGPHLTMAQARLVCLMLLCGRQFLGMTGALRVILSADGTLPASVLAEGGSTVSSPEIRELLAGNCGERPDPRRVEFLLLSPVAAQAGARIALVEGESGIALRALPQ